MKKDTALLVIDVQAGMFPETDPVYAGDLLLQRIAQLISRARACRVPVIYVQHNEGPGEELETQTPAWNIHSDVSPDPADTVIQKYTPDSFHETNLQEELAAKEIHTLVIAGLQTDFCINATSRRAHRLGYELIVASDAHSTWGRGTQSAAQIIEEHNEQFRSFAALERSADIVFC